jgi:hypothetical protein
VGGLHLIRQQFSIQRYWRVIVYYNLDNGSLGNVQRDLKHVGFSTYKIRRLLNEILKGSAKAATCSNLKEHVSIVLFGVHKSKKDYINSIVHEAEHIKQAMLKVYHVMDRGEAPAYTIGYIVQKMYKVFIDLICNCYGK